MTKYMKDPRVKPPREKGYEDKPVKWHSSKHKPATKRADHKHYYEKCIIKEAVGLYTFLTVGQKCKYCNRIVKGKFLMTNEIPESLKDLPVIEVSK